LNPFWNILSTHGLSFQGRSVPEVLLSKPRSHLFLEEERSVETNLLRRRI
jgi:hypothetical protein